jgi:hypothetical protein
MEVKMKKITKATIKSFIKKNFNDLYISTKSRFNGMIDCVDSCADQSFRKVEKDVRERFHDTSLGIKDAYFVGSSRDYFKPYGLEGFKGYEIYNCVGCFILAVKEEK